MSIDLFTDPNILHELILLFEGLLIVMYIMRVDLYLPLRTNTKNTHCLKTKYNPELKRHISFLSRKLLSYGVDFSNSLCHNVETFARNLMEYVLYLTKTCTFFYSFANEIHHVAHDQQESSES